MNKKCRVAITGGLGNQLFKFANALRIAREFESELILDITFYDYVSLNKNYATPRNFELHDFPNLRNYTIERQSNGFLNRIFSKFMRSSPRFVRERFGYFTELDDLQRFSRIKVIEGSFEDLRYLPDHEYLRRMLIFPAKKSDMLSRLISEILDAKPLSLHVRLTDFTKNPQLYGVISREYYRSSVEAFKTIHPNQPLWLFSDDPEAAKLFLGPEFVFERVLSPLETQNSIETLELLSLSFGICAANSTFSWWAGFLGTLNSTSSFVSIPKKFNTLASDFPEKKLKLPAWHIF